MTTVLLILHVLVCVILIGVVLIQGGKGAEIGAAFGGSSQTLFGSRGAATFLSKLTTIVAIVFMLTSLGLAILQTKSTSVIKENVPIEQKKELPAQQPLPQPPQQPSPTNK
ncbi:MAG: preprotein translocase subunit SecG [Thermodesulfovibrionales bacterium]|nr:preprotein translocase subunit SecG [Thermodesulfovibrionales bacterium]